MGGKGYLETTVVAQSSCQIVGDALETAAVVDEMAGDHQQFGHMPLSAL